MAHAAFDTEFLIDFLGFLDIAGDGSHLALPQAGQATGARFRINGVFQQGPADQGRAFFLPDVGLIFLPEVFQGAEHRVHRALAQAAEGGRGHGGAQLFHQG